MQTRRNKKPRVQTSSFEIPANGHLYTVNATPFTVATGDTLFRVSYNDGPVHIFNWDEGLERYAEADAQSEVIPPVIEMAIAERIYEFASQMQHAA